MDETAPAMLSMPAELLHRVFENLGKQDVLSMRAICTTLAEFGKEYVLRSIVAIYKRDSFERVLEASKHPYFSQRIKTLHFQADKFDEKLSYRKWKELVQKHLNGQKHIQAMDAYMDQHSDGPWDEEKLQAMTIAMKNDMPLLNDTLPRKELAASFDAYCKFLDDQDAMDEENLATDCLTQLFERCPELVEVTFKTGPGQTTHYELVKRAFRECRESPHVDDPAREGVDQWIRLIDALSVSKKALKSLTVCPASFNIVNGLHSRSTMMGIMSTLDTLKLGIDCFFDDNADDEEEFFEVEEAARELIEEGELVHWLSAAKGLCMLKLRMPAFDLSESIWTNLSWVVGDTAWDHLTELSISTVETIEDVLVELLLRHKTTLRRLCLSYIDLCTTGGWNSVFTRLSGNLPELRRIALPGPFKQYGETIYHFSTLSSEGEKIDALRDHIEDRLLNGGKLHFPFSEDEAAEYDAMLRDGHDGKLCSEVPGYSPPRKNGFHEGEDHDDEEIEDEFDYE
ncbi:hypothetical protein CLAFUW4_08148 [Fulvia fulva]|uniref:F-box domain-containing protein n=1 Tax=Passalora fulva TaxID=5499 RepID=A0A9Q8P6Z5_PASFU|nr:uncharacterized protein CLAFUR5_08262 [Fulvia fulva]KAK4629428.1 hypothetical protein CLAFUR4_08153 [Fulvia fulva]KAK4630816.1 hypothetical protein CLAFUR0_08148 [Fulvia fulva]UJO15539.1 hypothetical protein CLAFUR5_08262 [Fulvia fulva]WPV12113.1 hypothetical protein CLAFUW4_08148 [Fulvia fulva]WPV27953.1 hypothetical protein CLAFUW7_08148 [Fulvia fulva]